MRRVHVAAPAEGELAKLRSLARRHEYLATAVFLAGVLCVYFWPLLLGHQLSQSHLLFHYYPWLGEQPADFDVALRNGAIDAPLQYFPLTSLAREQIHTGQLPLWNPYSYAGTTLLGDFQTALLYPLTWLGIVLPLESAWGPMAALKLFTAGMGAYAFARQLSIGRPGALISGLIYMLSAPLVLWLQWPLATVFSLLPWLLLVTDRLYRRPGRRRLFALASVVTLSILAGHPETALLSSSAAAVYLLALMAADRQRARARARYLSVVTQWLLGHLLGLAASAVVLVPFLQAYADSLTRVAHGDPISTLRPPLWSWIVYALPNVFGDGRPDYFGPPLSYVHVGAYFGVAALLLAAVWAVRARRAATTVAVVATALVALAAAFSIPPVDSILRHIPPYADANTSRVLYVVALAGAIGAGAGFTSLSQRPLTYRRAAAYCSALLVLVMLGLGLAQLGGHLDAPLSVEVGAFLRFVIVLALGLLCLIAVGRLRRTRALALVLVITVLELAYLQGFNAILPEDEAHPSETGAISFLQRLPEPFRVARFRTSPTLPDVLPPNTATLYGLEATSGYDFPQSRRWADFSWFVLGERGLTREVTLQTPLPPSAPAITGYRMLNARYAIAEPNAAPPTSDFRVIYRGRDATIFRLTEALPRAYVVPAIRRLTDSAALAAFAQGELDPRREAAVPVDAPDPVVGPTAMRPARVEQLSPRHVRVWLPPDADGGWLVLANAYSEQWKAEVDGRAATIYPTNFTVMGLPVRPGARTVDFRLDETGFRIGAGISGVVVIFIAVLAVAPARRLRPKEGATTAARPLGSAHATSG